MAEFEFTQQQMADAQKGFDQCSAALNADMKTLNQRYQDAIGRGLAGKNVAMLIRLYQEGIQPTCVKISETMNQMSADIHKTQGQYNNGYDAVAQQNLQKILSQVDGTGGAATGGNGGVSTGHLSQMINM
jgi:hypothetical protein